MNEKSVIAKRAIARRRGREYLWKQIQAMNGLRGSCPSNKELRQWAHSHPEILPKEHRGRLLEASQKNLPVELGFILFGKPVEKRSMVQPKAKNNSKDFYFSWEWKKARYETLKRWGAECMCCGSTDRIVVDHIKPRSKFPELELNLENLQVLCNDCNMGKSNDDYTDWRPKDGLTVEERLDLELLESARNAIH